LIDDRNNYESRTVS